MKKAPPKTPASEPGSNTTPSPKTRRTLARRRLLHSLAAGSAAVTVKALPSAWTRPLLDTAALPAHAVTTLPADFALSCEVGDVDSGTAFAVNFEDPLRGNGARGTVWVTDFGEVPATWGVDNIHAWTDPIDVPITLNISTVGNATIDTGAISSNGTQHAGPGDTLDFGQLSVTLQDGDTDEGTVDFTFSAGGRSCSIDIVFSEFPPLATVIGP